jgi:hypothetical protein
LLIFLRRRTQSAHLKIMFVQMFNLHSKNERKKPTCGGLEANLNDTAMLNKISDGSQHTTQNLYVYLNIIFNQIKMIFYNYISGCYSLYGEIINRGNVSECYQSCHSTLQNVFQHFAFKVKGFVLLSTEPDKRHMYISSNTFHWYTSPFLLNLM